MILIVESGSTKADWVIINNSEIYLSFKTKGWNPFFLSKDQMEERLQSYTELKGVNFQEVYFYTAGVNTKVSYDNLHTVLSAFFVDVPINIESDIVAAARSVYNNVPLYVGILGTGSNLSFYDGHGFHHSTPSLGYILGDEASGAALGKELLKSYLYKSMPRDLYLKFSKEHSISKELVLESVYTKDHPNKFLASYAPFLVANRTHEFVVNLFKREFLKYLKLHLLSQANCHDYKLSLVGSVAFYFKNEIEFICKDNNIQLGKVLRSPITKLVDFHIDLSNSKNNYS